MQASGSTVCEQSEQRGWTFSLASRPRGGPSSQDFAVLYASDSPQASLRVYRGGVIDSHPFPVLKQPLRSNHGIGLVQIKLSTYHQRHTQSLRGNVRTQISVPIRTLMGTFASRAHLLHSLPRALHFNRVTSCNLPRHQVIGLNRQWDDGVDRSLFYTRRAQ